MRRILLTGFEPFAGSTLNPSQEILRSFDRDGITHYASEQAAAIANVEIVTAILPVIDGQAERSAMHAIAAARPDAVLCLGEAARRREIAIERIFINLRDYPTADNSGERIESQPIVEDGPAAYFATLPVEVMCAAVRERGIPAGISLTAGTFLCNQIAYALLHAQAQHALPMMPCGFIHVPCLPEQVARDERRGAASMSLDMQCRAVAAAVGVMIANVPARVSA